MDALRRSVEESKSANRARRPTRSGKSTSAGLPPRAEQLGWGLASHAAVALTSARSNAQLRTAIETRQQIGQAVGRIMERYRLPEQTAFSVLQRCPQHNSSKWREVAETIVRTGRIPGI